MPDEPVVNEPVVNEPVVKEPVVNEPVVKEPVKIELKLNEGSMLTQDDLNRISDYASKRGLSQEDATELLSNEESAVKMGAEAVEKKQEELLAAEQKRWIEAGQADPEIGGDKYKESAELAKRVIDKFGTEDLKKALESSKLGNYHEFVRLMSRIGRAMDSDKLIIGDMVNKEPKSIEERLYGKTKE